ncbi:MAG: glutamine--fructose-6-phosphate transaminase (isomerizing) [Desulfurococcales archaeon]|nr:glutamine--fructose-6-phosphate transaminase (isomerizing) [Desulfurococcales archaeon]
MCGIIGLTTEKRGNIAELLVEGLRRLEYRGYDSVGIALVGSNGLVIRKAAGKIDDFAKKIDFASLKGKAGIGHTRWATHGSPTDYNAHPHTDCRDEIAVVHNGVIRNFASLREELAARNHRLKSETDTELIAHLIEEYLARGDEFIVAFAKALSRLQGTYALAIVHRREPDRVYFARMRSPLLLGLGEGENAVASDIPALLTVTRRILPLEDGEFGYITPREVKIYRLNEEGVARVPAGELASRTKTIEWTPEAASKSGYPHFMIKEIYEQPQALYDTYNGSIEDPAVREAARLLVESDKVIIVAAGTSYHAGLVLHYFLSRLAKRISSPLIASEYEVLLPVVDKDTLVVAVSQSGETFDTLEAVRHYMERGAKVVGVTNVIGSALSRYADLSLYTRAGPEIGVAATKTYLTQILLLELLAVAASRENNVIDEDEARLLRNMIGDAPVVVKDAIEVGDPEARELSRVIQRSSMYILGRGLGAYLAKEAALKVKEIAYVHAEAYPAGESKHGPIALVDKGFPVFVLGTSDSPEVSGNAIEMRARGAWVRVVKPANLELDLPRDIMVQDSPPTSHILLEPFSIIPFFQLLAYHMAVRRGYDPDKPRNLAKTVTVE